MSRKNVAVHNKVKYEIKTLYISILIETGSFERQFYSLLQEFVPCTLRLNLDP